MRSEIVITALIAAATVVSVKYFDAAGDRREEKVAQQQSVSRDGDAHLQIATATPARIIDEVRIAASYDRQFYTHADVNRRSANFLIDTGASYVALRDSDARDAGIYTKWADYSYPVRTANGETKAALVVLENVEIGGIAVKNVQAFILPDEQLSVNLLGMSFLSRLDSVEARGNEMILRG